MEVNILNLPIDVLALICEQIESFEHKKNFARAHPKLWDAFVYSSRKDVQNKIEFNGHNDEHWDFILEWWNQDITTIKIGFCTKVDSGDLVEKAAKYCPNLEYLILEVKEYHIKKLEEYLPKLNMLKNLYLDYDGPWKDNGERPHSSYNLIKMLQGLTNLRYLHFNFGGSFKKERDELNKLTQLEKFEISTIKAEDVSDLSTLLGNLRVLNINETDTETLTQFAKHCTKLEKLILSEYHNTSTLPYFPKLVYLQLNTLKEDTMNNFLSKLDYRYHDQLKGINIKWLDVDEQQFAHIAKFKVLKELECLYISPSCTKDIMRLPLESISTSWGYLMDPLRFVKECLTLKELTSNYSDLEEGFFSNLLNILNAKEFQPDQPFQLNIKHMEMEKKKLVTQIASIPKSNLLNIRLIDVDFQINIY